MITNVEEQIIVLGVTGHRKLSHEQGVVREAFRKKLKEYNPDVVITGMALGFDMLVAEVCIEEKIPFIAAIPCMNQIKKWPPKQKKRYREIIDKAWKYKIVSSGQFEIWKLFERNKWIVNRSNIMLSYWNGIEKGGTWATVKFAKKNKKIYENLFSLCVSPDK